MPYDFTPYIQSTRPAGGQPGKGVYIKMDDFYLYPDGHGNICAAATDELPGLNQPFADPYQGIEIMAGIWRAMRKEMKLLESPSIYKVGDHVLIDGATPAEIHSTWNGHHFKVKTDDGAKRLIKIARLSKR